MYKMRNFSDEAPEITFLASKMKVVIALLSVYIVATSAFSPWLNLPEDLQVDDQRLTQSSSCGASKVTYDGDKIVGGRNALQGEFPWQVSLQRKSWTGSFSHICGGSVIGGRYILTAAHCVDGGSASQFQVVVGAHNLKSPSSNQVAHKVSKIVVHERYNSNTINNDIAILVLSSGVNTASSNGYVNSACLPQSRSEPSGTVTATGWGATREGGSAASVLQAVDLPVVSDAQCRAAYGSSAIADSMLCAGVSSGGKDSCQGDSGGPLVQRVNGKGVLVGVVSWGYGCARPNYPGVYTQVSHFIDWIQTNAP